VPRAPFMLDLFAGLGGASVAMRARGWDVLAVDSEKKFKPDLVEDIEQLSLITTTPVDLLWASPPCTEFAAMSMPWSRARRGDRPPSLELVNAVARLVNEVQPRWWLLENVRGAQPYLKHLPFIGHAGPVYLWGEMPDGYTTDLRALRIAPYKEKITGKRPDLRSKTPFEISELTAQAIEDSLA
jgi:hypothetical protein